MTFSQCAGTTLQVLQCILKQIKTKFGCANQIHSLVGLTVLGGNEMKWSKKFQSVEIRPLTVSIAYSSDTRVLGEGNNRIRIC